MLRDPVFAARAAPYLDPDRLHRAPVRLLLAHACAYVQAHSSHPSAVALLQLVRADVDAGRVTADELADCGAALEDAFDLSDVDSDFVLEQVLEEARKSAMWRALEAGLKVFKTGRYDDIAETVVSAAQIGKLDTAPGLDFGANLDARTEARKNNVSVNRTGTGIPELDDVIKGGLAAGELGCLLGGPKFGKSQSLNFIAMHAMEMGGTVVYESLEMSESEIAERLDAAISRIPISQFQQRADEVRDRVENWMCECGGRVFLKQFPSGQTTVRTIEGHLKYLRTSKNVEPTLLVVDYGDLLTSDGREERRHEELASVYTDLRGLGVKWQIPVWTASQVKREALAKDRISLGDIAESFKKVAIADLIVAICRTEAEISDGSVRFFVAGCRFAPSGVELGPFKTDLGQGRIYVPSGLPKGDDEL